MFFTVTERGPSDCGGYSVSYLHRVEADGAEAVHAPGEGAHRTAPLLVPDVHLLATRHKHAVALVVVQPCEHRL